MKPFKDPKLNKKNNGKAMNTESKNFLQSSTNSPLKQGVLFTNKQQTIIDKWNQGKFQKLFNKLQLLSQGGDLPNSIEI